MKIFLSVLLGYLFFSFLPISPLYSQLDLNRFMDSAHHWYGINDEDRIIQPLPDQPKYNAEEYQNIADNILLFQKENGGWAKNFDMQAILDDEQRAKVLADKPIENTTFDNGATHSQLSYLAEVYTITKDDKYKDAFLKGLDFILTAQYQNGGWPQFFPDTSGYRKYITFNDGAMMGVIKILENIVNKNSNYLFIHDPKYQEVKNAFEKGIDCILDMQIVDEDRTTVWCQQHDQVTLKPQNARTFEPASICNGESSEIVLFLMSLENPSDRIKSAIINAVSWFEDSAIEGIRVEVIKAPKEEYKYHTTSFDRVVVEDEDAPRIWTRFYELETHRPMFCRRDGKIVYSLAEVERERRTGYGYYNYAPEEVLSYFSEWKQKWE
ncbi:MAG: pectate lyase [Ignavibacteriales bacterium]|nr:pectate lyase [Ignavibacteriales bacterium]